MMTKPHPENDVACSAISEKPARNVKRVFLFKVKTQFENLGDALINRELILCLSRRGLVLADVGAAPERFRGWLALDSVDGVRAFTSRREATLSPVLAYVRLLISGGRLTYVLNPGGNVGEIGRLTYLKRRLRAIFLKILKLCRVELLSIGVSYEALGRRNLKITQETASLLDVHAVRDSSSVAYCRSNGIRVTGVVPDLAFNLDRAPHAGERPHDILFSMRDCADAESHSVLVKLIADAHTNNECALSYQVDFDRNYQEVLAFDVFAACGQRPAVVENLSSISAAIDCYSDYKIVVSNRLHVLLLALRAGAQPVALVHGNQQSKIKGLFSDLGMTGRILILNSDVTFADVLTAAGTGGDLGGLFEEQRRLLDARLSEFGFAHAA